MILPDKLCLRIPTEQPAVEPDAATSENNLGHREDERDETKSLVQYEYCFTPRYERTCTHPMPRREMRPTANELVDKDSGITHEGYRKSDDYHSELMASKTGSFGLRVCRGLEGQDS